MHMTSHTFFVLAAGLAVWGISSGMLAAADTTPLLFEETFDSGALSPLWSQHLLPTDHASAIVETPARSGKCAHCTTLLVTDPTPEGVSGARAEVTLQNEITGTDGDERWYGLSIFIPSDYTADLRANPEIILQWLPVWGRGFSPSLAWVVREDTLTIENLWDEGMAETDVENPNEHYVPRVGEHRARLASIPMNTLRGQWTDWVVHGKWSSHEDGLLEIWKNGEQIVKRTGPNCRRTAMNFAFKFGVYKWRWDARNYGRPRTQIDKRVIYHDEIRIAGADGSYDTVAPRGERPTAKGDAEADPEADAPQARDGEGPAPRLRDGDNPVEGPRDGDRQRTGPRDGDRPRTGRRDGERGTPGPRDGDAAIGDAPPR